MTSGCRERYGFFSVIFSMAALLTRPPTFPHTCIMRRMLFLGLVFLPVIEIKASPQEDAIEYHRNFQSDGEGVVIAVTGGGTASFGHSGDLRKNGTAMNPDTLFEIGSITKVFTGILLADAVNQGKAALDDPISMHLPAGLLAEDSPLRSVTLMDLATHTSGLPRLPVNLEAGANPKDPYAHYSVEKLHSYLRDFKATDFEKRGEVNYSNLGMGLLGHLLERIAGKPYEELIRDSVFAPLGMGSSFIQRSPGSVPAESKDRLATGHSGGRPVEHWHIDSLCGAGAMVSSARDMMKFAEAHWSAGTPESLKKAMELAAKPQRNGVGLGWFTGNEGLQHDGGTGGFQTELRVNPDKKSASLKFMNSSGPSATGGNVGDFKPLAGYWEGTLNTGQAKLRLLLRIAVEGGIVMHSLDQGGIGIPAGKAVSTEGKLSVVFSSIGAKFEGNLKGGKLTGQWLQGKDFPLVLIKREGIPVELKESLKRRMKGDPTVVAGFWSGYLGGKTGLFLILEIESFDGTGEARIYSPDQHPEPIALSSFSFDGESLDFEISDLGASYRGSLDESGELKGNWKQNQTNQPLHLKHSMKCPVKE